MEETGPYQPVIESHPTDSSSPHSSDRPRFAPGQVLASRYRIVASLGKGGMGEVFRADDLRLGQAVALKFLPARVAGDAERLARLRGEVRLARQVSQANVCRVYDLEEFDSETFLTMEFIDGQDLAGLLRQVGRLPEERGVEIARQLCLALAAVHDKGVLHRDLKPQNVMIDGRGQVRLTDFGLAAVASEITEDIRAGTPAYMAPEQLGGKEVTARSDLYALGLVLYELFTGKRPFEAQGGERQSRQSAERPPSKPSSHVSGLNPAVESVILRCLEKDPKDRPRSAYEVVAALPGGDPLAAALAAGETPSPKMVADAPVEGSLHPAVAGGLLAVVVGGLLLMGWLGDRFKAYRHIPLPAPAVLEDKARAMIRELGYTEPPADSGGGFNNNFPYLKHLMQEGKWGEERQHFATGRPASVVYWYRQSPRPLMPGKFADRAGSDLSHVMRDNPPHDEPGMVMVRVDTRGRLVGLLAVPDRMSDPPPVPLGWEALLRAAGLDAPGVLRLAPKLPPTPPVYADQTAAWEGTYPERPDISIRVEAGSYRGRPVYFHIAHPAWDPPPLPASERAAKPLEFSSQAAEVVFFVVMGGVLVALVVLAIRNLRHGRGDGRGAARLAGTIVVLCLLMWLLQGGHVAYVPLQYARFMQSLEFALVGAAILAVGYLALEPVMRRRCPHRLTALARALDGRWRDPLVGRDVLIGAALGVVSVVEAAGFPFGTTMSGPILLDSHSFTRPAWTLLAATVGSISVMWAQTSIFLVLSLVVRRDWIAATLLFGLLVAVLVPAGIGSEWAMAGILFRLAVSVFVLLRFGVLALMVWFFVAIATALMPLTLDPSAWYVGASLMKMLVLSGLAMYGFVVSLGGRSLVRGWLGDE